MRATIFNRRDLPPRRRFQPSSTNQNDLHVIGVLHNSIDDPQEFPDEWEAIVRKLERAWFAGNQPKLGEFLPCEPEARQALLPELVLTDLEFRLKSREPARVEEYLERYPDLSRDRVVRRDHPIGKRLTWSFVARNLRWFAR